MDLNKPDLSRCRLLFGKYKGMCFDEVPLTYLDWLRSQDWLLPPLPQQLEEYLNQPSISRLLEEELG